MCVGVSAAACLAGRGGGRLCSGCDYYRYNCRAVRERARSLAFPVVKTLAPFGAGFFSLTLPPELRSSLQTALPPYVGFLSVLVRQPDRTTATARFFLCSMTVAAPWRRLASPSLTRSPRPRSAPRASQKFSVFV